MFNYSHRVWRPVSPLPSLAWVFGMDLTAALHHCVTQLVKQCQAMLEAGRVYCHTSKSFVSGLRDLGQHCSGDKTMEVKVAQFYTHAPFAQLSFYFQVHMHGRTAKFRMLHVRFCLAKQSKFMTIVKESNLKCLSCRSVWTNFPKSCQSSWTLRGWVLSPVKSRFSSAVESGQTSRQHALGHIWYLAVICARRDGSVSVSSTLFLGSDWDHTEVSQDEAAELCQRVSELLFHLILSEPHRHVCTKCQRIMIFHSPSPLPLSCSLILLAGRIRIRLEGMSHSMWQHWATFFAIYTFSVMQISKLR